MDDINNNNYKHDANKTTLCNVENVTFPTRFEVDFISFVVVNM